jgi:hypothetical protein
MGENLFVISAPTLGQPVHDQQMLDEDEQVPLRVLVGS